MFHYTEEQLLGRVLEFAHTWHPRDRERAIEAITCIHDMDTRHDAWDTLQNLVRNSEACIPDEVHYKGPPLKPDEVEARRKFFLKDLPRYPKTGPQPSPRKQKRRR